MGTGTHQRNHTVTAGHLRRFTRNGVLTVHDLNGGTKEIGPKGVGFQMNFWGTEELAREVEELLNKCETYVLGALQYLPERWPFDAKDRAEFAQFLTIHIVRTPAFGVFVRRMGEETIRDEAARARLTQEELAVAADLLLGPRMHVNTLLGQIPRIASLLSSMQWSLIRFDQDLLITGDQPVVLLPPGPASINPASAVPPNGLANTMEAWFTLDPRQMLLLTWHEGPDTEQPLDGTYSQACSVNCALRAQALEEWVSRPETTPPFLSPPLLQPNIYPISTELLPGYTAEVAVRSRRREAADQMMAKMIDEDTPRNEMRWVKVSKGSV